MAARKPPVRRELFIDEYLIDFNATQAAIRAGYSPVSARDTGYDLLNNPDVRARIDKKIAERSRRTGITAERVLQEMAKVGFVNIEDIADLTKGTVRRAASKDDTAAISSIKVKTTKSKEGTTTELEIKLHDKTRALMELGKHVGLFKNRVEIEGPESIIIEDNVPPEEAPHD